MQPHDVAIRAIQTHKASNLRPFTYLRFTQAITWRGFYKGAHLHLNSHNMESTLHSFIREFFFCLFLSLSFSFLFLLQSSKMNPVQTELGWQGIRGKQKKRESERAREKCGLPVPPVGKTEQKQKV